MTDNELLFQGEQFGHDVILRRYQSGRYSLTVAGLRLIFRYEQTPSGTNIHTLLNQDGETVGSVSWTDLPSEVNVLLDEIEHE